MEINLSVLIDNIEEILISRFIDIYSSITVGVYLITVPIIHGIVKENSAHWIGKYATARSLFHF